MTLLGIGYSLVDSVSSKVIYVPCEDLSDYIEKQKRQEPDYFWISFDDLKRQVQYIKAGLFVTAAVGACYYYWPRDSVDVPKLVKVIRHQEKQINRMENEIRKLDNRLEALENSNPHK